MTRKPEAICPDCGSVFDVKDPKRSTPQRRWFFALVKAAFHHWPDADPFRPRNVNHLRYFLEKEAGHLEPVKTVNCQTVDPGQLQAVLAAIFASAADDKLFVEVDGHQVHVVKALSISYDALDHLAACRLFDEVAAVLRARGLDPDDLLHETGAAA